MLNSSAWKELAGLTLKALNFVTGLLIDKREQLGLGGCYNNSVGIS